jgi:putative transposase
VPRQAGTHHQPDPGAPRHPDLVGRDFIATAPNQLWVTDLTFVATWAGIAYSMRSKWRAGREESCWRACDVTPMPDRNSPPFATASGSPRSERCPCIGTTGDSFDNALAETVNGYYKTELIYGPTHSGPWKTIEDVALATPSWVHWHNTSRLHDYLGDVPPAEFEATFYATKRIDQPLVEIQ